MKTDGLKKKEEDDFGANSIGVTFSDSNYPLYTAESVI